MRGGRFIQQVEGYRAFEPAVLPPADPPLQMDTDLIRLGCNAFGRAINGTHGNYLKLVISEFVPFHFVGN